MALKFAAAYRLRPLMNEVEMNEVIEFIKNDKSNDFSDLYFLPYSTIVEWLHTGKAMEIARVFIYLDNVNKTNGLSLGESRLLTETKNRLNQEFEATNNSFRIE